MGVMSVRRHNDRGEIDWIQTCDSEHSLGSAIATMLRGDMPSAIEVEDYTSGAFIVLRPERALGRLRRERLHQRLEDYFGGDGDLKAWDVQKFAKEFAAYADPEYSVHCLTALMRFIAGKKVIRSLYRDK